MRISKLQSSQRVRGRWIVFLDSGELLQVGENEVVDFGLYAGMELEEQLVEELTAAARQRQVMDKALDLLTARPLSRKELVDKLTARPRNREKEPLAAREQAENVADRLEALGYLNDEVYARTVAEHCAARGYGPRKVQDELFRRGVPREYWEEALACCGGPEDGVDAFLKKRFRGDMPDEKELRRACDALIRRGYRWEEIRDGLRRYGAETAE